MIRLGVNVDHVATIREARKTVEPDPVYAALIAEEAGADSIVVHLREDRRHIRERDVRAIREVLKVPMNLEMAAAEEIVAIALDVRPRQVTLVPEKREEVTTEGGLDVVAHAVRLSDVVGRLRAGGIHVSLFVDPDAAAIEASREAGADAVELHTGRYAEAWLAGDAGAELKALEEAAGIAAGLGLGTYAGHGLTYQNVRSVASIRAIEEFNIGHSIIARAVTVGVGRAIRDMIGEIERGARDRRR